MKMFTSRTNFEIPLNTNTNTILNDNNVNPLQSFVFEGSLAEKLRF